TQPRPATKRNLAPTRTRRPTPPARTVARKQQPGHRRHRTSPERRAHPGAIRRARTPDHRPHARRDVDVTDTRAHRTGAATLTHTPPSGRRRRRRRNTRLLSFVSEMRLRPGDAKGQPACTPRDGSDATAG